MKNITVTIADDHQLTRKTLKLLIECFGTYKVIAEATNGEEVVQQLKNSKVPQLLLLDLSMPKMNGCETAEYISKNFPKVNILVLTMFDTDALFQKLIRFGVKGIINKNCSDKELEKAMAIAADSKYYFSDAEMYKIINNANQSIPHKLVLNETELDFLKWCATDLGYKQIAEKMGISERKIDHIRDSLFLKLQIKNRSGLVLYAVKNALANLNWESSKCPAKI